MSTQTDLRVEAPVRVALEPINPGRPSLGFVAWGHVTARILGAMVAGVGAMVLFGWFFGVDGLTSLSPTFVAMKANTALCLLLSGSAVVLLETKRKGSSLPTLRIVRTLGFVVFMVGLATASQYLVGWDLGIDQILAKEATGTIGTISPGRMALSSTLCFMGIGVALILVHHQSARRCRAAQHLALLLMLMGIVSLTGYVYGVGAFQGVISWTPMAVHTAGSFLLLGVSICLATSTQGFMRVVSSSGSGGSLARRLLPVVFILPLVLGVIHMVGVKLDVFPTPFGISFMDSIIIVVLAGVTWGTARRLNEVDVERSALVQQRLQAMNELRITHTRLEAFNEELTRTKDVAESANRAKSEFLSRMSHELRTPLNAILGFAELLKMDELSGEQRGNVVEISRGGRHLLELTNEILDLAHIESGKLAISLEPVSVREVLEESISLISPLAAERGIELPEDVPDGEDHHVHADHHRLRQITLNLLANAVKYNRAGGRVDVSYVATPQQKVRVSVTDTGVGISPDSLKAMFEPFERLGAETTGVEGTGLGLSVSKALCEAMGGVMDVASRVGKGTTFSLELPLAEDAATTSPKEVDGQSKIEHLGVDPSALQGTVLYIEDNPSNIKLMELIFERLPGLQLITAGDGDSGLVAVEEQGPDLVLLDLHLPGQAGEEILRTIKADPSSAHRPVVIVSADATRRQLDRAMAFGADDYITKPIDLARLFDVLDRLLAVQVAS